MYLTYNTSFPVIYYAIVSTDVNDIKAKEKGCEIVLPCDWACGQDFKNDQPIRMVKQEEGIPDGWEGMDCGPLSMEKFRKVVLNSATVIWYDFVFYKKR